MGLLVQRYRSSRPALARFARADRPLAAISYGTGWDKARLAGPLSEEYRSPLARRPYDLRHACLSTWLNGGVAPTQVAEWAGHSVEVLLRVYARCLEGSDAGGCAVPRR